MGAKQILIKGPVGDGEYNPPPPYPIALPSNNASDKNK